MKKAVAAGVLLLLLFAASLWNIHFLDSVTAELTENVGRCREYCRAGDMASAENELAAAAERWERLGPYARIFLRQTETDAVEAVAVEVLEALRTGEADAAEVALTALERRLAAMTAMERVTWESVF